MEDDEYSTSADELKLSKINSAVLINQTINNLLLDFFRHFRAAKYLSANSDLDCIWIMLGGEKGIEGSTTEQDYNEIEKKISEIGKLQDSIEVKGFGKPDEKQLEKFDKHKTVLLKKALFLTRLRNIQGKGTAYDMGESDYMD